MLADWLPEFHRLLSRPPRGPGVWGVQLECLRVMTALVSSFSRLCAPHIGPAIAAAWALFAGGLPLYQRLAVEGEEPEEEGADAGGSGGEEEDTGGEGELDLGTLAAQLLEFVLALVGNQRYQGQMRASMPELLYLTLGKSNRPPQRAAATAAHLQADSARRRPPALPFTPAGYMQMTADQVERWAANPNEYVADEEDDFSSVRAGGEMLVVRALVFVWACARARVCVCG